jgi:hypothetical protein
MPGTPGAVQPQVRSGVPGGCNRWLAALCDCPTPYGSYAVFAFVIALRFADLGGIKATNERKAALTASEVGK